jgi:hypothetical protein
MKRSVILALAIAALSAWSVAHADSTTALAPTADAASGVSISSVDTNFDRFLQNTYFNYFAIFHGPSMTAVDSPYTIDRNGKQNNSPTAIGMNFDSEITAAYMVTSNIGIGADIPFLLSPVLGQGVVLGDLGGKIFEKRLTDDPNLFISTNLIIQGPTSKASEARDLNIAFKTTPAIRYNFHDSRFSIGSFNEIKYYQGVSMYQTFKLYADPYVNYILTPKLSLNFAYELEYHHNVNDTGYLNFTTYQTDFMPGFVYMITPKVLFNPYVQIFTDQTVAMDHTAIGAIISASI